MNRKDLWSSNSEYLRKVIALLHLEQHFQDFYMLGKESHKLENRFVWIPNKLFYSLSFFR